MERPRKGKQGVPATYEESFKIAVAREYLTGQFSQLQLAKKYGLPNGDTVHYFVKWYEKHQLVEPCSVEDPCFAAPDSTGELREQLHLAQLKITALEMLIKNAEKELNINIVKKSGTKPPVK